MTTLFGLLLILFVVAGWIYNFESKSDPVFRAKHEFGVESLWFRTMLWVLSRFVPFGVIAASWLLSTFCSYERNVATSKREDKEMEEVDKFLDLDRENLSQEIEEASYVEMK